MQPRKADWIQGVSLLVAEPQNGASERYGRRRIKAAPMADSKPENGGQLKRFSGENADGKGLKKWEVLGAGQDCHQGLD